jgi:hypothetical protein
VNPLPDTHAVTGNELLLYWAYRVSAYALLNLADDAAFLALVFC